MTARSVPLWATRAAHLVSLVVLPSSLWRVATAAGLDMGLDAHETAGLPGWESLWLVALSLLTEGLALLTLGLVRPWGERVPARVPLIGGRTIPPRPVVAAASLGALLLALIWGFAFRDPTMPGLTFTSAGWEVLFYACYVPLLLWAPLLAAVTVAYHRRRHRTRIENSAR
jgi:hypothetical protein